MCDIQPVDNIPDDVLECEDEDLKQAAIEAFTCENPSDRKKRKAYGAVRKYAKKIEAKKLEPFIKKNNKKWKAFLADVWVYSDS